MKRLLMLLALVFIHSTYAGSFAQTNIKSEFVNLKTDDGITLHGALWESTRPGSARGSRAESLAIAHRHAAWARVQNPLAIAHRHAAGSAPGSRAESLAIALKHAALERTRPGSARGSRAESLLQSHSGTRPEAHPARVQNL